jgi:hypothetical protein
MSARQAASFFNLAKADDTARIVTRRRRGAGSSRRSKSSGRKVPGEKFRAAWIVQRHEMAGGPARVNEAAANSGNRLARHRPLVTAASHR